MISFGLWIAKRFLGKTVTPQQAGRLGFWVALPLAIIAVALLVWGGKTLYDRGVVKQAMDKRDAAVAIGAREADQEADAAAVVRAEQAEAEVERLEDAMAEAKAADPAKGQSEVGPVQQSYFDNLPDKKRR
jgi:hypothetical protein